MRSIYILLVLLFSSYTTAQTLVYGLYTDDNAPYNGFSILATLDAGTGVVLEKDTIYGYDAVALGSSSFDQLSANYNYLAAGINGFDLLSRNVFSNTTISATPATMTANGLQFDMATGLTYGLGYEVIDSVLVDPELGWYDYVYGTTFLSIDIENGSTDFIAYLPEVDALALGASCFDPVNGMYYFIGVSSNSGTALFGIDASTGDLTVEIDLDLAPSEYLNELEYDIQGGVFYALHRVGLDTMYFSQVDAQDGTIYDLVDISSNVSAFTPDASVYHQDSQQFIMLTYGPRSILTIDADEGEVSSQALIDYSIIELEVDNVDYANAQFVSVSEFEVPPLQLFPNPSKDCLYLDDIRINTNVPYVIYDATGGVVMQGNYQAGRPLDIASIAPGVFTLSILSEESLLRTNFIKLD